MRVPAIYPAAGGVCPRCGTGDQDGNVFCSECHLRLAAGLLGLEGRAALASGGWMQANPERAEAWRARLGAEAEVAASRDIQTAPETPTESERNHQEALVAARAELATSALEARVLSQVAHKALLRLARARARCEAAGMSAAEISEHVTLDRVPGVEPVHAAGASPAVAGGGGFAFFYAEAGIDADGDGDVDGGLVDTLTDGVENGVDGALGFLGDLFG